MYRRKLKWEWENRAQDSSSQYTRSLHITSKVICNFIQVITHTRNCYTIDGVGDVVVVANGCVLEMENWQSISTRPTIHHTPHHHRHHSALHIDMVDCRHNGKITQFIKAIFCSEVNLQNGTCTARTDRTKRNETSQWMIIIMCLFENGWANPIPIPCLLLPPTFTVAIVDIQNEMGTKERVIIC